MLPENYVHLLSGVEPTDTAKPKMNERKAYVDFQRVRETLGIFPKAASP